MTGTKYGMINEEGSLGTSSLVKIEDFLSLDSVYELGKTIGRGEFAKVKVARCRVTKKLVLIEHCHGQ